MLLVEADGKELMRRAGIRVPAGRIIAKRGFERDWSKKTAYVVKAQVPVGGRGKEGGVVFCQSPDEIGPALDRIIGRKIRGHLVTECLIEEAATGSETYLSLMVSPEKGRVRLSFTSAGGVDVEAAAGEAGRLLAVEAEPDLSSVHQAIEHLSAEVPASVRRGFRDTALKLAEMFFARELLLAEINPLFIDGDQAIAGDAKVVVDVNAMDRQPDIVEIIRSRGHVYPDALRKLDEQFDYIELDGQGTIGLLTTGAGLSMMLVDELVARGGRPVNFCDIRTGQFRGSPARLIRTLEWLARSPGLRVIFVNIFAGITDLSEFARLLLEALEASPAVKVPVVARLVGNGSAGARRLLAERRPDILVFEDMEEALAQVAREAAR